MSFTNDFGLKVRVVEVEIVHGNIVEGDEDGERAEDARKDETIV
jgi:hypothetical protein